MHILVPTRDERGQATLAMVGVIAIASAAVILVAIFGEAVVHRAQARNAADAVALAAAVDPGAADSLTGWYAERQIFVERTGPQAIARSGPSQAAAWASTEPSASQPAPALVATIARAEQLLDTVFSSVQWQSLSVTMTVSDAAILRAVNVELGLCEQSTGSTDSERVVFELC